MAAISAVFTIGYVANLLGEEEDWLFDLAIGMEPEDGSLWVYGVGEDGVPAFTRGHRQPAPDRRRRKSGWKRTAAQAAEIAPLRCSPHAYLQKDITQSPGHSAVLNARRSVREMVEQAAL